MPIGVASAKSSQGNTRKPSRADFGFAFTIMIAAILFSAAFTYLGGK
jgi:hypothetical protein